MESKNKVILGVVVILLVIGAIYIFGGGAKPEPGIGPDGEKLPISAGPRAESATGTEEFFSASSTPLQPLNSSDALKEETETDIVVKGEEGELRAYTIEAGATRFTPSEIVVDKGDIVQIRVVALDETRDIAISEPLNLYFEVTKEKSVVFGFDALTEGRYNFSCQKYCPKGSEMSGVIIVR